MKMSRRRNTQNLKAGPRADKSFTEAQKPGREVAKKFYEVGTERYALAFYISKESFLSSCIFSEVQ